MVTCDVSLRDVHLARGDMISVPTVLANLDEGAWFSQRDQATNREAHGSKLTVAGPSLMHHFEAWC
jgi:hypothetical protein